YILIILVASPIILIDLGFKIYAVIDIFKVEREVRHISKIAWAVIVLIISFTWIVYLLIGRDDVTIKDRELS
ncbi:PLDc N-terminal domain-containing protein, partial [Methanocalculus natronophilus]|uniref:PLDc N-terminal domain-containing protein n=1 Tax=Methanocalculus natronophilus TaxID=1262400 RepID=UPI0031B59C6C